jgi:AraC-like DNA-binding protein
MRSPCLTCKYKNKDKDNEICFHCKKRLEYLRTEFGEGLASCPFLLDSCEKKMRSTGRQKNKGTPEKIHDALYKASKRYKVAIDKICCAPQTLNMTDHKKTLPARIFVTAQLYDVVSLQKIAGVLNTSPVTIYSYRDKAIQSGMLKQPENHHSKQKAPEEQARDLIDQICAQNGCTPVTLLNNTKANPHLRQIRSLICLKLHDDPFYMTAIEIARTLGLHKATVRDYIKEARLE